MTDKELVTALIDTFTSLQRIKNADDKDKEIDNQIRIVKTKLESCGVVTSDIELK